MNIAEFDHLSEGAQREILQQCCGAESWIDKMMKSLPAEDLIDLWESAEESWYACNEEDWMEAFSHHPEIGDISSLREKFASTANLAEKEQSGVKGSNDEVLHELAEANKRYKEKFGYIFIISAAGKSGNEILDELKIRLSNNPSEEIKNAMEEQNKITKLRLEKLFA